jgi:bifunctional pyridoxal-dependent enzyme with beta-cystathionase and maltose regulon repressor activities
MPKYFKQSKLKSFQRQREFQSIVTRRINEMPGLHTVAPDGCYVSFIDVRETGMTSQDFQTKMLHEARVALVPGLSEWFGPGAEGYVRLSFATSAEILEDALNRIESKL